MPHMTNRQPHNRKPLVIAIFTATLALHGGVIQPLFSSASQASAQQATQTYQIAPGPLGAVLSQFANEAGVVLSFDAALTNGKNSQGLQGSYSVDGGLKKLLSGSGLRFIKAGGNYVLEAISDHGSSLQLEATSIMGSRQQHGVRDEAVSEGTGTYAAQAATLFKSAKSLREIPQSVSVITREQMNDQGITRLEDVYTQLPGVRLDGWANQSSVMVRGFSASTQSDGVPMQGESVWQLDPAIYDRVELLRGPSGMLTGSGEPGGAINLVRKRPRDQFAASARLSYGSWANARSEFDFTGPLNESGSLRGRGVAVLQEKDEFYDEADERRNVLYGVLEYDLTPNDTLGFSATRLENVSNIFWGLPRYSDGSLPDRDSFVGATDVDSTMDITELALDYKHRFDNDWQAKATYSHRKQEHTQAGFIVYGPIDVATGLSSGSGYYQDSEEDLKSFDLNLNGPFSLWGLTHHATIGYNKAIRDYLSKRRDGPDFDVADVLNNHDWGGSSIIWAPLGDAEYAKQSGLYGSLNIRLLEPLTLTLGGRATDYATRSRSGYAGLWVDGMEENGEFTPYAGLVYDLTEQLSLYGSYAEIFVPQSYKDYTGAVLPPRTGEQYELGIKGAFFDDMLNASLAIYQLRDVNRAIDDPDPTHICTGRWWTTRCTAAAGEIQSRGFEAEVSGTPTPGLNLVASYTFNRSKYLNATPENIGKTPDAYRTPKHLLKLWAHYRLSESPWQESLKDWSVGAGLIGQSSVYQDDGSGARQGGYAVVSAKLGYRLTDNADLAFDVDNLFDRVYLSNLGTATIDNTYGKPRSYRLTMNYRFD